MKKQVHFLSSPLIAAPHAGLQTINGQEYPLTNEKACAVIGIKTIVDDGLPAFEY